jgi:hypothetical protein
MFKKCLQTYTFPGTDITIEEGHYVKIYNTDISRKIQFCFRIFGTYEKDNLRDVFNHLVRRLSIMCDFLM